jgi:Domain of unknown function (DUF3471)
MKNHKTPRLLFLCITFVLFSLAALQGQSVTQGTSEISVDENTLKSYVGRYDYGQGMVLIVTLEDNQLYAQLTGQPLFPIFPSSKEQFFWKVVDAGVTFVADEKGIVTHAIHRQNGGQFDAKKLPDETPVIVDPAIFDKYVGKYDAGNNNIVIISKEGDKLYAQGLNLPKYQLLPASETEYFLREINARAVFKITDNSRTDTILINFSGVESTAMRIKE